MIIKFKADANGDYNTIANWVDNSNNPAGRIPIAGDDVYFLANVTSNFPATTPVFLNVHFDVYGTNVHNNPFIKATGAINCLGTGFDGGASGGAFQATSVTLLGMPNWNATTTCSTLSMGYGGSSSGGAGVVYSTAITVAINDLSGDIACDAQNSTMTISNCELSYVLAGNLNAYDSKLGISQILGPVNLNNTIVLYAGLIAGEITLSSGSSLGDPALGFDPGTTNFTGVVTGKINLSGTACYVFGTGADIRGDIVIPPDSNESYLVGNFRYAPGGTPGGRNTRVTNSGSGNGINGSEILGMA